MPIPIKTELNEGPFLGLWDRPATSGLNKRYLRECFNVDLRGGVLMRRLGNRRINNTALSGTQHGIFYAKFNSGTNERLVAHGTGVSKVTREPTALTTNFPSDMTARVGAKTYFVQIENQVFMCNGEDLDWKYNGTNMQKWGISAPASAPTITEVSGSVTSTRRYRTTYYNSTSGHEGPPSAATGDKTLDNEDATISSPATPTDPQVDQYRAYAAIVTAGRPGTYYRIGTANLASTLTDNFSDANLKVRNILEEFLNNPPSDIGPFYMIAQHQGRVLAVPDNDRSILYISDHGGFYSKPESFPIFNFLPINYRGGDEIRAIASFDELALIFMKFSIWGMMGSWPDIRLVAVSYQPDRTSIGTIEHKAIKVFDQGVVFPSHDGVYALTKGDKPGLGFFKQSKISDVIDDFYDFVDQNATIHAAYDRSRRQYRLFCSLRTGQNVNAVRVIA